MKTVGIVLGGLFLANFSSPNSFSLREQLVGHIRRMIGLSATDNYSLERYAYKDAKSFCEQVLQDCQEELYKEISTQHLQIILRYQDILNEGEDDLKSCDKRASGAVKQIFTELAKKWNLGTSIRVVNGADKECPMNIALAHLSTIVINESLWQEEYAGNRDVLVFIAGHELLHIKNKDVDSDLLKKALERHGDIQQSQRISQEWLMRMSRLAEVRADVISAIDTKEALRGYRAWTDTLLRGSGDTGGAGCTHPLTSERLKLACLLEALMGERAKAPGKRKYSEVTSQRGEHSILKA